MTLWVAENRDTHSRDRAGISRDAIYPEGYQSSVREHSMLGERKYPIVGSIQRSCIWGVV